MIYKILLALCLAASLSLPEARAAQAGALKVVVVVDGSASFRSHVNEAVEKAVALLGSMSQKQTHRWQKGAEEIYVVSLDAMPEVVWTGGLAALKSAGADSWTRRFKARSDYAGCTDVGAAFALAAKLLAAESSLEARYLFVFSDLIDEPPTTSLRTCAPPGGIPENLPWEALAQISTAVFWLPPDQKLLWRRAASENGLGDNIALYTTSESGAVEVPAPVKPTKTHTDEERKAMRGKTVDTVNAVGSWLLRAFLYIGIGFVLLLAIVFAIGRQRRTAPARVPARFTPANPR